jgi:two-component system chemotaxis sensor kinase CheA
MEAGLLGTDIIRGRMTLFPDIYGLIEKAEPGWFKGNGDADEATGGAGRSVLLVEDSPFLLHMIKTYLESEGFEVNAAANGREALELLSETGADLIVSDLEMPEMDGFEFIKAVRRDPELAGIPALALTSMNTEDDRRRALNAGFDDFQVKIDRERFLREAARLAGAPGEVARAV